MQLFSLTLISVVCCFRSSCSPNTYTVMVVTGKTPGKQPGPHPRPGTSAAAYIGLNGSKSFYGMYHLNGEAVFKPGETTAYNIDAEDVGQIQSIKLGLVNTLKKGDDIWLVKGVYIYDRMRHSSQWYECNYWFNATQKNKNVTKDFTPRNDSASYYKVIVETGDQKEAGTNGTVYLTLLGSEGDSRKIRLDHEWTSEFQRGQTDTFYISTEDIGDVSKIRIELDSTAESHSPNWFLKAVSLVDEASKLEKWFPWYQWLTPTAHHKKISVEIPVSTNKGKR